MREQVCLGACSRPMYTLHQSTNVASPPIWHSVTVCCVGLNDTAAVVTERQEMRFWALYSVDSQGFGLGFGHISHVWADHRCVLQQFSFCSGVVAHKSLWCNGWTSQVSQKLVADL
jgi:hypothetical protein